MVEKCRVLLVDDDERLLKAAKRVLHKHITLKTAVGGKEALKVLADEKPFAVIISDQNMPDMQGTELLEKVGKSWPNMTRIMLTGNNDLETAVQAVNSGRIFRFLNKPCQPEDLLEAIKDGEKHHNLITSEKALLEKTLSGSVKVLVDVLALSNPIAFQKASKVRKLLSDFGNFIEIPRLWEVEVAAMLWPLGNITLPAELLQKIEQDALLTASEQQMVEKVPEAARNLISNIPRMENVAEAIYYCRKNYDGTGTPHDSVKGADIPNQARLLHILIHFVTLQESENANDEVVLTEMKKQSELYDPAYLKVLEAMLAQTQPQDTQQTILEIMPAALKEGDIIAKDIYDDAHKKLLAAGNEITSLTITRLRNMAELKLLTKPIYVNRSN